MAQARGTRPAVIGRGCSGCGERDLDLIAAAGAAMQAEKDLPPHHPMPTPVLEPEDYSVPMPRPARQVRQTYSGWAIKPHSLPPPVHF